MRVWKAKAAFLPVLLLAGCSLMASKPTPVAVQNQPPIKEAAHEFIAALASGDEAQISDTSLVDADPATQRLAAIVRKDAAISRQLHLQLTQRFDVEEESTPVGSEEWLGNFADLTDHAGILQADKRARIGDETTDGVLFLRQVDGAWKVELIPTLVAESGGRQNVTDPNVEYRFNVSTALNEMLLGRLEQGEFSSYSDYQHARNIFWAQYLALIANGEEPHDKLLATLPHLPKEGMELAANR
jgi:hypothetical protein